MYFHSHNIYKKLLSSPCRMFSTEKRLTIIKRPLASFESINQTMGKVKKILGHLWYLSEGLVSFAFFDYKLSVQDKNVVDVLRIEGVQRIAQKEKALMSNT